MACHNGFQTVVNQALIYLSKSLVPLFAGKCIDTVGNMLISVIQTVSREMLCRAAEARIGMGAVQLGL